MYFNINSAVNRYTRFIQQIQPLQHYRGHWRLVALGVLLVVRVGALLGRCSMKLAPLLFQTRQHIGHGSTLQLAGRVAQRALVPASVDVRQPRQIVLEQRVADITVLE